MSAPNVSPEDIALVDEVLRSGALSMGPMIERFEAAWAARLGVPHAVAVSSGTAGLHLALITAGVSTGDCVITSPFSFVASANAALYEGALPIFVDIDPTSLALDPAAAASALADLEAGGHAAARWLPRHMPDGWAGRPAKAVLPVHVFGQPAAMTPILAAAGRHRAMVIEDACEAIGSEYEGRPAGAMGEVGVFGFYPNKQMTTGEGGVVVTRDAAHAGLLRSLRNQGRDENATWLRHVRLGYNYRLDDMSAALGLGQIRRLDALLAQRARVAAAYDERLEGIEEVERPSRVATTTKIGWFVYVIRLAAGTDRDAIVAALAAEGVPSRPYFPPIHLQPFYRERFGYREGDFPVTEAIARTTLALPFHGQMTDEEVDIVASAIERALCTPAHAASPVATGDR
jgi:dTDP-4-amino-4,6-dideoxygalactose transaminase